MIPPFGKLFDKLVSLRKDSPSQKVSYKTKGSFEVGGNAFSNTIANNNGRDGVHISEGNTVEIITLSTTQRTLVVSFREEWSKRHGLNRSTDVYKQSWEIGELEYVNKRLKEVGKTWRIEE